jgi:hypothetical protein
VRACLATQRQRVPRQHESLRAPQPASAPVSYGDPGVPQPFQGRKASTAAAATAPAPAACCAPPDSAAAVAAAAAAPATGSAAGGCPAAREALRAGERAGRAPGRRRGRSGLHMHFMVKEVAAIISANGLKRNEGCARAHPRKGPRPPRAGPRGPPSRRPSPPGAFLRFRAHLRASLRGSGERLDPRLGRGEGGRGPTTQPRPDASLPPAPRTTHGRRAGPGRQWLGPHAPGRPPCARRRRGAPRRRRRLRPRACQLRSSMRGRMRGLRGGMWGLHGPGPSRVPGAACGARARALQHRRSAAAAVAQSLGLDKSFDPCPPPLRAPP